MNPNGIEKARLVEIKNYSVDTKLADPVPKSQGHPGPVTVDFNPQTLKLAFSNKNSGGDQPGGSGKQFVGSGASTLSVELIFDTTSDSSDVRKKTALVAFFVMAAPQKGNTKNKRTPPRVRFEWGSFIFEGVVESMDETLEYFSENGVPLRATTALRLARDDITFMFGTPGKATPTDAPGVPGAQPLTQARAGDSMQQLASRDGRSGDWKAIAAANNIDDPLRLQAGALLNMNASASVGASVGGGISLGASAGFSAGASAGADASAGFSAGLGGGVGFSAGASASASVGAGASASAGISAGIGVSTGVGVSAGVGVKAGVGASASAGLNAGASAGFSTR